MRALCQWQHPCDTAFIHTGFGGNKDAENKHHGKIRDSAYGRRYCRRHTAHRIQNLRSKTLHVLSRDVETSGLNLVANRFDLRFDNGLQTCGLRRQFGPCEHKGPIHKPKDGEHDHGQAEATRDRQYAAK